MLMCNKKKHARKSNCLCVLSLNKCHNQNSVNQNYLSAYSHRLNLK